MRTIKFRAWVYDKAGKKFNMYYSDKEAKGLKGFLEWLWPLRENNLDILMQFTGLLDKNGREIYEGDIVDANKVNMVIEWGNFVSAWILRFGKHTGDFEYIAKYRNDFEVIGNIYSNPELLEKANGKEAKNNGT